MIDRRLLAYLLIGIGTVALLGRLAGGTGWLWIGLVAVGFLFAYSREGTFALLAIGSVLAGISVGILLEGNFRWNGAFLVSLGAGFAVIDLIDPRSSRWPSLVGALLIAVGLITGVAQAGVLGSGWFALVLIAAGVYLIVRRRNGGWVAVGPPPGSEVPYADAPQPPRPPEPPHEREAVDRAGLRRERLLAWRARQAQQEDRSEGLILPDATLERIADENPSSIAELGAVHGVGPVTVERYGPAILAALAGGS